MSQCGLEDNNGTALMPKSVTMNSTSSMRASTSVPMGSATAATFKREAAKRGAATLAIFGSQRLVRETRSIPPLEKLDGWA